MCFRGSSGCGPGPRSFLEGGLGRKGGSQDPRVERRKGLFRCTGFWAISEVWLGTQPQEKLKTGVAVRIDIPKSPWTQRG